MQFAYNNISREGVNYCYSYINKKLYNCVLARNIRIKTKAPVKLTGAPLLGLAKSIYYSSPNYFPWSDGSEIRSAL